MSEGSPGWSSSGEWDLDRVTGLKGDHRIAVVIPARNEEATIASVVREILDNLGDLVDDAIVMDSLSSDATAEIARGAGARVHSVADVRPDLGVHAGKGEALWKSLFVTDADLLVFIDADLTDWGSHFVTGLVGPLLADPGIMLVRGFYDRVLNAGSSPSLEGGRVTELLARPWLALHRPELGGVIQPLAGEWSIRRSAFEQLPVPMGYGVELSTLLDIDERFGLAAIAQVDLGRRAHRHQSLHDLSAMSLELLVTAERRRRRPDASSAAAVVEPVGGDDSVALRLPTLDRAWTVREVMTAERPPYASVVG
jgi:glucosyl-3-phosphoglycerate synthase